MEKKIIANLLSEQKKAFTLLSSEIISYVHDNLKLLINEMGHPPGGFKWRIDGKDKRVMLELYYDGMVLLYFMEKENGFYPDTEDCTPQIIYLTEEENIDSLIEKLKTFFA